MQQLELCAPCLFGLESVLAHEVGKIGAEEVRAADGRVSFRGDEAVLARANLWLRTAERVCVVLGSGRAETFQELIDLAESLPFERFIGRQDAFPVKGWSLKSKLHSIPDCQSIIKKAAVNRLGKVYKQSWLEETGPVHQIQFSILKDEVTIMLDTSGVGLHKRGYRRNANEAPIKETLAAGIVDLARLRRDERVIDPMCGSGTFLIEGAMRAFNIAPGVRRRFAAESWGVCHPEIWKAQRESALEAIDRTSGFAGFGFDSDGPSLTLTRENAAKAGVGKKLTLEQRDIADFSMEGPGVVFCNPPYGERMLELREAEELYRTMGRVFPQGPGMRYYIISPHEGFEELFGRRADKRRKLYNGMIKCQLFMYFR